MVENVSSNVCGNGFGKSGVPVGTVALPAVTVGRAVDEGASGSAVPVGIALPTVVAVDSAGAGSEFVCRLCGV